MILKACRHHTWMMTLLYVGNCFCAVSITQSSTNVVKGSSLNIIATFDENGMSWTFKSGTPLTSCSLSFNGCIPSMDKNMVFSASSLTNTSTISIASLNCSINTAIYIASTDSSQTDTVDIDVTTPVSSIMSTTVLTTNKVQSQELLVEVECVYPKSTITANFTISRSGKPDDILFPDSIQTSTSSLGCECSEATYVVKKTITASQYPNEVVHVQANIGQLSPLVIGDVNFTAGEVSKESKAIEERSEKVVERTAQIEPVWTVGHGSGSGKIQKLGKLTFTNPVAKRWHFSNQYTLFGTVVYGIQIVLVSAVSDIVTIAIVVGVLVYYCGQIKCITILYLFLLTAAFSIVGVLIYMLILAFFGDKDLIHIKFKKKKDSIKLSAHGMKPIKDNICIYFKVKAIYASITLHIIENMEEHHDGSKPKIRQLKKVLTLCFIDNMNDSNDSNHGNAIQYQAFYLKCENKTKTITVFDGNYKQIEQWTISADSFKIGDIEISNIKPDDSTKDDSANYDSTKDDSKIDNSSKDNSTEIEQAELYTSEEWKFWFREGDTLSENSQFHQTVLLFCVVILPIAWLVMIVLVLINLFKSEEKNTDNTESELKVNPNQNQKEPSEQQIKKQNDAKGKWFDFIWFSCFHNSVKPNSTTDDNKPKAMMPGSYLANSPKGRNLPKLPEIVTQGDEIRKTKRKDKKKKKIKNQDSKMNDKQQSHSDKQDITCQPEIAVPAYTLETE